MQVRLSYGAIITIIVLSVLLAQCVYEPQESFHNPIAEPEPIQVNIDLESPEFTNPFYLDFVTNFTFSFGQTSKPLAQHAVILNNTSVLSSTVQNKKIIFTLNPLTIGQGTHNIHIYLAFKTGSESLAEQLEMEYYQYEIEFTVVITNQPPSLISPLSAKIENGYLKIRWKTNTNRPYRFVMSNGIRNSVVSNFNQNFEYIYIDSGYVGNPTSYNLSMSNAFGTHFVGTTSSPPSPTHFELKKSDANLYQLEWTSSIYPANVSLVGTSGIVSVPITQGQVALDSLHFGDALNYRLIVSRNIYQDQRFDSAFVLKSEKNFPTFSSLKVISQSNLYLIKKMELFRLSLPDFQPADSSTTSSNTSHEYREFNFSADGSFITVLAFDRSVPIIINPNDLKEATAFGAFMHTPTGSTEHAAATHHNPASINKLLGANIIYNGLPTPIVYDLNVDAYAFPYDTFTRLDSANFDTPLFSPDGNFYCLNDRDQLRKEVYKDMGGVWNRVGYMPIGDFYFRVGSGLELISIGAGKVTTYDLAILPVGEGEFQATREFTISPVPPGSQQGQIGYDELTEMIFVETIDQFNLSTIRLYDVQSFAHKGSMKASVRSNTPNTNVRHIYSGGYHFVSTGYAEKVIP
ncbi:MAG TPA: hypothetical protein PK185_16180 [Cyclobacteriaceae bacterium]|nr:hypothetical protein [Cyclobacteriaceae bacterium]